jgi:hypothetical protein
MKTLQRLFFLIGCVFARTADQLCGRSLAINVVFTPQETSHGTASLLPDVVVGFANAVVVRGSDDRHFKLTVDGSEVPLGILQRDSVDTGETNVVAKGIALFGLYPESIPAVAAAAIAVDAELVMDIATPGRVKALPTTPGAYFVIGRSRFTVAAAGDPVSIEHQTPVLKKVGAGYVAGDGGAVTQITSSSTGVTLNKLTGQITTVALTTAAAAEERFTVTDSAIAATDTVALGTTYNGAGTPMLGVVNVTAGAFDIVVTNLHASAALNALMVINFAIVKAVAA